MLAPRADRDEDRVVVGLVGGVAAVGVKAAAGTTWTGMFAHDNEAAKARETPVQLRMWLVLVVWCRAYCGKFFGAVQAKWKGTAGSRGNRTPQEK